MAIAMYMQFPHTTREQYDKVVKDLSLKDKTPAGLLYHVAGPLEGGWCVMDVWDNQASFDKFYKEKLEKAMQSANIPAPQGNKSFAVHSTLGHAAMARH
jgi:hypothetical protein